MDRFTTSAAGGGAYLNCKARINGRSYTFGADSKVQVPKWVVKGGNGIW